MADTKGASSNTLIQHLLIHAALLVIVIILVPSYWLAALVVLLSHGLIDFLKRWMPEKYAKPTFVVDQLLHIGVIIGINTWMNLNSLLVPVWLNHPAVYQWVLLLTIVSKPVNTIFKILFQTYQPIAGPVAETFPKDAEHFYAEVKEESGTWLIKGKINDKPKREITETIKGAGANLGILERILAALLLSVNQYGALGIIFTAKSITRYDKISKDPAFAVLLVYLIIF